jgi:hypothetical protein
MWHGSVRYKQTKGAQFETVGKFGNFSQKVVGQSHMHVGFNRNKLSKTKQKPGHRTKKTKLNGPKSKDRIQRIFIMLHVHFEINNNNHIKYYYYY